MASLASMGQQLPLVVVRSEEANRYVLVDGYKRVRALRKLRQDRAYSTVWELEQEEALVLEQLMRRGEGAGPIQQGWLLVELQDRFGMSQQELARRFDKSQSWVSRRLALVRELPTRLQELVREGRLSSHIAMKLLVPMARANADDASRLAEAMARLGLSCRDAYRLHAGFMHSGTRGRELLLEKPELYLRADTEAGRPSSESPSPIEPGDGRARCARRHSPAYVSSSRRWPAASRSRAGPRACAANGTCGTTKSPRPFWSHRFGACPCWTRAPVERYWSCTHEVSACAGLRSFSVCLVVRCAVSSGVIPVTYPR